MVCSINKDFVNSYSSNVCTGSILCLEKGISASKIEAGGSRLFQLHYIVIQGRMNQLPAFLIRDVDSQQDFEVSDALTVYTQ